MYKAGTTNSVEHSFWPVKSQDPIIYNNPPGSMIHHKVTLSEKGNMIVRYNRGIGNTYGVSLSRRVLSSGLLLKKSDLVQDCLRYVLGLTDAQIRVTFRLLRFHAYYGQVYPKESQVTEEPGCSKATFWRTVKLLRERSLVTVINRYVLRPHAQISNLYRLDKLVIVIAKYLAEHIGHVWPDWLGEWIKVPWPKLWPIITGNTLKLPSLACGRCTAS